MIAANKNIEKVPAKSRRGSVRTVAWCALAVAIAVCAAIFYLVPSADNGAGVPDEPAERGTIREVAPSAPSAPSAVAPAAPQKSEEELERERRREMFSRMTVDEKIEYLHGRIRDMPIPETPTNRLYATSLEQVMDWVFTCEVGNPPPLLPPMSLFDQMHLAEILIMDNPVLDTDSERAAESKEMVKVAKEEFIKFLKEGGNPDDFLPYYHGQLVAAHEEWKMAKQSIVEMVRTEPDIALEYAKKVNERLAEKGIKQVTIPRRMLEAFGIEEEYED